MIMVWRLTLCIIFIRKCRFLGFVHYSVKWHWFLYQKCSVGLKYAKNALAAGAPPRTPLGELTTLPRPSNWLGRGHPLPNPHWPRRLRRSAYMTPQCKILVMPWFCHPQMLLTTHGTIVSASVYGEGCEQGGHRPPPWSPYGAPLGWSTHVSQCRSLLLECLDNVLALLGSNARMLARRVVDKEEPHNWPQYSAAAYTRAFSILHVLLPTYFVLTTRLPTNLR